MTSKRTDTQHAISALQGSALLVDLIQKSLQQHREDLGAIAIAIAAALEALRRRGDGVE